ncbi:deoxyribose-phosphate aldolase [Pseudidiomarina aestuarii]|nr:deoxyribose-phosphate aldolase [Pseudidiomarina aestuarii]
MDLTSLQNSDTPAQIKALCDKAASEFGSPAALCVYPELVATARQRLDSLNLQQVQVATVVNFPVGEDSTASVVAATERALAVGASEIDVVMPYLRFNAGDVQHCWQLLSAVRTATRDRAVLKVIIESGELASATAIRAASNLVLEVGADFIKTSTGKVAVNATLEAAEAILSTIRDSGRDIGFKVAGGVRTVAEAEDYFKLARALMGNDWVTPERFRIGASSLLQDVLRVLGNVNDQAELVADDKKGLY